MDDSPLARLAPELRNRIYELALQTDQPLTLVKEGYSIQLEDQPINEPGLPYHSSATIPALLRTCKAIYHEASQLFYATNTFRFGYYAETPAGAFDAFNHFVSLIGNENSAALRDVTFALEWWRFDETGKGGVGKCCESLLRAMGVAEKLSKCSITVEATVFYWARVVRPGRRSRKKREYATFYFDVWNLMLSFEEAAQLELHELKSSHVRDNLAAAYARLLTGRTLENCGDYGRGRKRQFSSIHGLEDEVEPQSSSALAWSDRSREMRVEDHLGGQCRGRRASPDYSLGSRVEASSETARFNEMADESNLWPRY